MTKQIPHVLHVGAAQHPWSAFPIERLVVRGDTPTGVRVWPGTLPGAIARNGQRIVNRPDHLVYCLDDDAAWEATQQALAGWQASLDALAGALRELGRYDLRLAAGGKTAPNPLTPTVVHFWLPPDRVYRPNFACTGDVPEAKRVEAVRHTSKMIWFTDESSAAQTHCYLCPDDAAWARVQELRAAAVAARRAWSDLLARLETYANRRGRL